MRFHLITQLPHGSKKSFQPLTFLGRHEKDLPTIGSRSGPQGFDLFRRTQIYLVDDL